MNNFIHQGLNTYVHIFYTVFIIEFFYEANKLVVSGLYVSVLSCVCVVESATCAYACKMKMKNRLASKNIQVCKLQILHAHSLPASLRRHR